ncbi:MAG: cyclic nucleotide-binding domain-containing protein [Acidobacteriota bacterium]|nr:cyclic nucleotide-binding domain-containing protein [Acidobacteriota bacterium]
MDYDLYAQLESFNTRLTMNTMQFLMKNGEVVKYEKGAIVSREGDPSDHVYIIIDGSALVRKTDHLGNQVKIATIESGGLFGEMGVFLDMRRSATIVAQTPMTAARFTNENFINALPRTPDLTVKLLRSLTEKVNKVNWRVADMAISNAMLVIGTYILECPVLDDLASCIMDSELVKKETRLEQHKIVDALKTFHKRGLIRNLAFNDGRNFVFEAKVPELKKFLRKLAAKT